MNTQTVEKIIAKFGSQVNVSKALAEVGDDIGQTTVSAWARSGVIPTRHIRPLMQAARNLGFELTPDDFFEPIPTTPTSAPA